MLGRDFLGLDRSLRRMKMAIYAQVSVYFWPFDGRADRNNCRSRCIASHKSRMTNASAASGAARVRSETRAFDAANGPAAAEALADKLAGGHWTHDYALTATEARELGLPVKVGMPQEVLALMMLY